MDVFLYVILFIMGTFFGSFFTLAVYRIPLKKDITHERSFCPNCNHKLGALDLVPVWSYLFLKGKCRYCGEQVRIRYLLLEVLSGLVFVLAYWSFHIQDIFWEMNKLIYFIAFVWMYITVVLVSGIDKEYRKINQSVLLFGVIGQAFYMLYLYIIEATSMYRYIIYFVIFVALLIGYYILRKKKECYWLEIILFLSYLVLILELKAVAVIMILSLFFMLILRLMFPKKYEKITNIPWGFIIGCATIFYAIVENFLEFWMI